VKPRSRRTRSSTSTETGSSLARNKLRIVDTLLESTPRLIANKDATRIRGSSASSTGSR